MFMSFATMLVGRLEQAAGFINSVFMVAPRLQEFFEVLDTVPAVHDRPNAIDPGRLTGRVEFEDVSFSYDGKRPAVADLTFTAQPGEVIALVGPTGAGKTTALALLHRVFDPQSGRITIDGIDLRDMKLAGAPPQYRRGVPGSAAAQPLDRAKTSPVGKPDATEEEMLDALARAQALEFVERNPDGLKAIVGERGRLLSGGERQRLSIARALLKNPPILILDEATSALDAATEVKVQAALDEVMKDRTTFVIAHRLATIRNATRILVFQDGRIVESGSFDELVAQGGAFAELAAAQFLVAEKKTAEDAAEKSSLFRLKRERKARLLDPLQNADVIRHRGAAHIEDAAELRVLDLNIARRCPSAASRSAHAWRRRWRRSGGLSLSGRRTD